MLSTVAQCTACAGCSAPRQVAIPRSIVQTVLHSPVALRKRSGPLGVKRELE